MQSNDYHDYVFKDGKFVGAFEEMYQNVDDPWHHGEAKAIPYDMVLHLLGRYQVCSAGGKILDIGCGKGAFTARLARHCPDAAIKAIDISPTAINKAQEQYGSSKIEFQVMDIQKELKNITDDFDLIVVSDVMWYILPKFKEIMGHLSGHILRERGYLIINQTLYKPGQQKYGKEIVSTIEDMLACISITPIDIFEINRMANYHAVAIFQK